MLKERLHWYFHAISNCILHPLSCYTPYKYCFLVFPCAFRFFGVLSGFLVLFGIYMDRKKSLFTQKRYNKTRKSMYSNKL